MGKHKCVYCGKEGYLSFYFCEEHLAMRKAELLQKCEKCGSWYHVKEGCKCGAVAATVESKPKSVDIAYTAYNAYTKKHEDFYQTISVGLQFDYNMYPRRMSSQPRVYTVSDIDTKKERIYFDIPNGNKKDTYSWAFSVVSEHLGAGTLIVPNGEAKSAEERPQTAKPSVMLAPTSKCLICNAEANGKQFCNDCYNKYKNKALLIKVENCADVAVLDVSYEGHFVCDDGHIVKSLSEVTIDNYLFHEKIQHAYEQAIPIADEEGKIHQIRPDFYLPNHDIYIEHFGITGNDEYDQKKAFKLNLYKREGLTVMCTKFKDLSNAKAILTEKIKFPKRGEIYE